MPSATSRRVPHRLVRAAPAPGDDEAVRSWLSVVQAYHLCEALMSRRLAALDVKLAEHEILVNLKREPGLSQQQLAQRCFSAKSHISGLLGSLEERGWVLREPDPADARAKRLFLAPAGARVAERTGAAQAAVVAAMADAVTPAAMARVTETMRALSARLQDLIDDGEA